MAILPQKKLFGWEEIENLEDLERLRLVIEYMPDETLMRMLERDRGLGRNDYPVRGMWNAMLAGVVYQHCSVNSLIRELLRNGQLRRMCGLEKAPPPWVFTRFLKKLLRVEEEIKDIFNHLVAQISAELPDFGEEMAVDGKAIDTHARYRKNGEQEPDGRRDTDADWGKKEYKRQNKDGTVWTNIVSRFGYMLHLVVDAVYELPIAYEITPASYAEVPQGHELLQGMEKEHPKLLERCQYFMSDRGYDDSKLIISLYDDYGIKPVIDIRNMWKNGEETCLVRGQKNVVYDYRGNVYCYCPCSGERREMANAGFEKTRKTLKYRCPAEHYGLECEGKEYCLVKKAIRISINEDRRIFTPLSRSSYQWKTLYKKRTSVERVNSRLDVSFGFENHYIRGQKKMKLRMGLSFCVMLAMALGRIKEKRKEEMCSLVKPV